MKKKLQQLLETIKQAENDVESRQLFTTVVSQYLALGTVTPVQMARDFRVSVPTIKRWRDGQSECHEYVRSYAYRLLKEKVQELMN